MSGSGASDEPDKLGRMASQARWTLVLGGVAALVALVGGLLLYSRHVAQRERSEQAEAFVERVDAAMLALDRCVSGREEPGLVGHGLIERLRTRDLAEYQREFSACVATFADEIVPLQRALGLAPFEALRITDTEVAELCWSLSFIRDQRDQWVDQLGLVRESVALDCRGPWVSARTLDTREASASWTVHEHATGGLVLTRPTSDGPRHGWVEPEQGVTTWFATPESIDPISTLPLQVVGAQAVLLAHELDALVLGSWRETSGKRESFESRPLDLPQPSAFVATSERWFFVVEQRDALDIQASNDAGRTMTKLSVPLPVEHQGEAARALWADAQAEQLTLVIVRDASVLLVRVDAQGRASVSSLALERATTPALSICTGEAGAFATLDNQLVLHLGDAPTILRELAPATARALACVGEKAFVVVDDGASLQRLICDARGCADPALLAVGELDVALRSTKGGVHVLVLDGPLDLHLVDQPLGGELERVERVTRQPGVEQGPLALDELPVHVDGVLFAAPTQVLVDTPPNL